MFEFLSDLFWILALLASVLSVCCVVNWLWPDAAVDGVHVFTTLAVFALVFDAALTFAVFADSHQHYARYTTTGAFAGRACAYLFAGAIGLCFAWLRARRSQPS